MSSNFTFVGEDLSLSNVEIDPNVRKSVTESAGSPMSDALQEQFIQHCLDNGHLELVED